MTQDQKMREDIHNRYTLTLAERAILDPDSENYKTLSKLLNLILKEYEIHSNYTHHIRYGFRLYGTEYHIVSLERDQKY